MTDPVGKNTAAFGAVKRRVRRLIHGPAPATPSDLNEMTPKAREELTYWFKKRRKEQKLSNSWYRFFYTQHFGLDDSFFSKKRILDIGCGPRGSLRWARMARSRVGIDPLAHRYVDLGIKRHRMSYITALGEDLPIAASSFDVVCSFNSLDHVDTLEPVVSEIVRVLAPDGILLLLVDINHDPTDSEPLRLSWDVVDKFVPPLDLVRELRYEKAEGVYQSVLLGSHYDDTKKDAHPGVLSAMFRKPR